MKRVVITGLGPVTATGLGDAFWGNLISGRSHVTRNKLLTPSPGQAANAATVNLEDAVVVARRAPHWKDIEHRLRRLEDTDRKFLPNRTLYMTLAAAQLALEDAGVDGQLLAERAADIGGIIGNTCGDAASLFGGKPTTMYTALNPPHGPSGALSMAFGLHGPSHGAAAACASGNVAIIAAVEKILLGRSPLMLAGGASALIYPNVAWESMNRLGVMVDKEGPPEESYSVVDQDSAGFVIGEGAAVLVLEELQHARARKARIYAEVAGCSQRMYSTRMMLDVDTRGYEHVLQEALREAGLSSHNLREQRLYINLHGTGTKQGDAAELAAIQRAFGESQLGANVFASGTKPSYGHAQDASSAIESVICALSLHHGQMPGTPNLKKPLHPGLLLGQTREMNHSLALNLAAGFTGYHTAILFKKYRD
jgi:3-oxoacyl-[acyl-carrier-protein] synthase II